MKSEWREFETTLMSLLGFSADETLARWAVRLWLAGAIVMLTLVIAAFGLGQPAFDRYGYVFELAFFAIAIPFAAIALYQVWKKARE